MHGIKQLIKTKTSYGCKNYRSVLHHEETRVHYLKVKTEASKYFNKMFGVFWQFLAKKASMGESSRYFLNFFNVYVKITI